LKKIYKLLFIVSLLSSISCKKEPKQSILPQKDNSVILSYHEKYLLEISKLIRSKKIDTSNMISLDKGSFLMGGTSKQARENEFPQHNKVVNAFLIDKYEVTNAQFKTFIEQTNYITTAERSIEIEGETFPPGALVFNGNNPNNWWDFIEGANWKHPYGPNSSIKEKDNYPVVQVSWYDAMAYAHWANKKLPTEAQYEYASRGKLKSNMYPWGNDYNEAILYSNFFQGEFPTKNTIIDNYEKSAQVGSFKPNSVGLYDISGNVWEWCLDTYYPNAYSKTDNLEDGSFQKYYNSKQQKVMRGGSYLCNESYCTGYRSAARMSSSPDTGLEHTGFRCVLF
jgi:formylglycine-generating enzyme required for sulfatase activity